MQNSADVPKPVVGITSGVYSSEAIEPDENLKRVLDAISSRQEHLSFFSAYDHLEHPGDPNGRLHLTMEAFEAALDTKMLIKKCLVSDNPLAASKLALLSGNIMQAFEFSLQAYLKAGLKGNDLFDAFIYFLNFPMEDLEAEVKRQLLERLIACWQDQKFSFVQLENLFIQVSFD